MWSTIVLTAFHVFTTLDHQKSMVMTWGWWLWHLMAVRGTIFNHSLLYMLPDTSENMLALVVGSIFVGPQKSVVSNRPTENEVPFGLSPFGPRSRRHHRKRGWGVEYKQVLPTNIGKTDTLYTGTQSFRQEIKKNYGKTVRPTTLMACYFLVCRLLSKSIDIESPWGT